MPHSTSKRYQSNLAVNEKNAGELRANGSPASCRPLGVEITLPAAGREFQRNPLDSRRAVQVALAAGFSANCPRSDFTNRASAPFFCSSLRIAEYRVACGVAPPGLVQ